MNVYRRYFRVKKGPLIDAIKEANGINAKAHDEYKAILKEIGAKPQYYHVGQRLVALIFDGNPDTGLYKKSGKGWFPKKSCKAGKELTKRLLSVKTKDPQDALEAVGLHHSPTIFTHDRCYYPTMIVIPASPPVAYVTVPWYEEDPKKLEDYKKDRKAGIHMDRTMDALLWEPTDDMEPAKEWEMKRHIDEWNESIKDGEQDS